MHISNPNTQLVKTDNSLELSVFRLDKLHSEIQGNKYYKLKYNIAEAKKLNKETIVTFGGAYSNHIHATALAGKKYNINTIGIIRGEKNSALNFTLHEAENAGMKLIYVNRTLYNELRISSYSSNLVEQILIKNNIQNISNLYIIPEGGTNALALKGSAEIIDDIETEFDYLCLPVGTGGTIAGIINKLNGRKKIIGFSSLKGNFSEVDVKNLLATTNSTNYTNWHINNDYHFGGYAKWNLELIDFINKFKLETNIPLCPIYTGKMMFGIFDLIKNNYFPKNSKILALHTGGLQGIEGYNEANNNLLK